MQHCSWNGTSADDCTARVFIAARMLSRLRSEASVRTRVKKIEAEVADGQRTPALAAERILELLQ